MTTTTTKTLLSFQIHPNSTPKLISLQVTAGINFQRVNLILIVEECSEKSGRGLDMRSLVAKLGPGKHSILFWKVKEGFWSKALFSVYFCTFSSKPTTGDKTFETSRPPPNYSKLEGCLLFSVSGDGEGISLFSCFEVIFLNSFFFYYRQVLQCYLRIIIN